MLTPKATETPLRLGIFGAAPDTGNLGVSALCHSVLSGLGGRINDAALTVFDNGRGLRMRDYQRLRLTRPVSHCGMRNSRRIYQHDSMINMQLTAMLGGTGNANLNALKNLDVALDISGGDSFTDLYGAHRFQTITRTKQLLLRLRRPLILLPQTYGPFANISNRKTSSEIVRAADYAWARDARSFEYLKELLQGEYDPRRHRRGVDVAFLLPPKKPRAIPECLTEPTREVVGININGLIYNDPVGAKQNFGLMADYRRAVVEIVRQILRESNCTIMLLPHVLTPTGHPESDLDACLDVCRQVGKSYSDRIFIPDANYNDQEAKWMIARTSWFCGTRMHSTIASLSSGVPTLAIAYSKKTLGVFETCAQGHNVVDPRLLQTEELIELAVRRFSERESIRKQICATLPKLLETAKQQMDEISSACCALSRTPEAVF
ncbi:polysaccharide pyruvyl transferase family protein [Biformimicrobium ophioploci]|uniref:Polysaccharide pyruvyl transferase domain-containing protein n=1 Tax=Biformimicrobium ophioploci TaxID=3036711 RepID=A0ABQ6M096_9GAMM|nr:polysaccharide pyruvyl transferase family protein [Microbulbifer sp. NKW57]GMG87752.1 hypothetical protein MNKW57_20730 [Microbulbifer sp. NKW57]